MTRHSWLLQRQIDDGEVRSDGSAWATETPPQEGTPMSVLQWHDPEWYDPKDGDYDEAFAASDPEFFTECQVTHRVLDPTDPFYQPDDNGWFWLVKATSNLSEYPEVQDCGSCTDADDGKAKCEAAVQKILARNPQKKVY